MKLKIDNDNYSDKQHRLLGVLMKEIIESIDIELEPEQEELVRATESIAFGIAVILDGGRKFRGKNKDLVPHLTFADDRNERKELVTDKSGSHMHEHVHAWLQQYFGKKCLELLD